MGTVPVHSFDAEEQVGEGSSRPGWLFPVPHCPHCPHLSRISHVPSPYQYQEDLRFNTRRDEQNNPTTEMKSCSGIRYQSIARILLYSSPHKKIKTMEDSSYTPLTSRPKSRLRICISFHQKLTSALTVSRWPMSEFPPPLLPSPALTTSFPFFFPIPSFPLPLPPPPVSRRKVGSAKLGFESGKRGVKKTYEVINMR